jgi:hypothetical protein
MPTPAKNLTPAGQPSGLSVIAGSVSAERFVCDYADSNLSNANAPKGLCDGCPHYRHATQLTDDDNDDWCWLKDGKYGDGQWEQCPAWIASQNEKGQP